MTVIDFINQIESMYGNFTTEGMKKAVVARIAKLSESQLDKLFETYIRSIPGTYKPDLKNVLDCMDKASIKPKPPMKKCASCGSEWDSTSYSCPRCGYEKEDGDPVSYHYDFVNQCGRFDREAIRQLMVDFSAKMQAKRVRL